MVQSRLGLKAMGLCALVLGLMAFSTSAAQATAGAKWMINGADIESGGVVTLLGTLKGEVENGTASLLSTILGIPTKILCKKAELIKVSLEKEGSLSQGKIKFSECALFLNGSATASAPCLPKSAGLNDVIGTRDFLGLIVLPLASVPEILIKPEEAGGSLVVIESSEECAVGQKIKITGHILLKDCPGSSLIAEQVVHLVEADNSVTHNTLKAAGQVATIDGSLNLSLTGPHTGLKWSGLPA